MLALHAGPAANKGPGQPGAQGVHHLRTAPRPDRGPLEGRGGSAGAPEQAERGGQGAQASRHAGAPPAVSWWPLSGTSLATLSYTHSSIPNLLYLKFVS